MRRIRYSVATSLDGYIAGPKGEFDWIETNPDFDFGALFKQFDTLLAGRGTFETMAAAGRTCNPGMKTIVVSKTLRPERRPDVAVVRDTGALKDLKARPESRRADPPRPRQTHRSRLGSDFARIRHSP
jgi:dihydrofolate reductase